MGVDKESIKLAIKDEFLGRFRQMNAGEGDVLSMDWLYNDFLPSLSKKEEKILEETISEMINEGIIARADSRATTYQLTRKGQEMLCL